MIDGGHQTVQSRSNKRRLLSITVTSKALSTLSQKSATVAELRQSHFSATVWTGLKVADEPGPSFN